LNAHAIEALESYLTKAAVDHVRPLHGGAGHARKMTLILRGGIGVAAKPGDSDQMMKQARREVAAWMLAVELGLSHLVPATVLRRIPSTNDPNADSIQGSVQILWPLFRTALDEEITPELCAEGVSWQIAVFDLLIANTDRKEDNWGTIEGLPRAVLIDHGSAFEAADSHSLFVDRHREERIPDTLLEQIKAFAESRDKSRLPEVLGVEESNAVFDRAATIIEYSTLSVR
jgi:hypothetical protein